LGDRGPFDTVDPETLQIIPYHPDHATIYSKNEPKFENVPLQDFNDQQDILVAEPLPDVNNILDQYRSNPRTRRSIEKSHDPFETFAPHEKRPESLEELYENTLPRVRNQLKQKGLKQAGSVRYHNTSLVFDKYKYSTSKPAKQQHDPFKPTSPYSDPSLNAFTPKQWTGEHPSDPNDDLLLAAIRDISTEFIIEPYPIAFLGDKLSYQLIIHHSSHIQHDILVSIRVSHLNRILLHTERKITGQHSITSDLGIRLTLVGEYVVHAQIFLKSSNGDKILLNTHQSRVQVTHSPQLK
jgi:hypothetical protein